MLKKLVNEAFFTLRITTTGPLMIRSGQATVSGPDMAPVRTTRNGQMEVFLPGSSLKGVFRSHLEKIVCSIKPRIACYPFWGNESHHDSALLSQREQDYRFSCSGRFTNQTRNDERRKYLEEHTDEVYSDCCPICRLFGSTGFIGRVAIGDAYLTSKASLESRDGVGIDRLTGGASHGAKFELEVVSPGAVFETDIHLRNFEMWQLGMLFVVLQDLEDELIRLGSGRSRGLGQVRAEVSPEEKPGRLGGVVVSSIRTAKAEAREPLSELWGLGRWLALEQVQMKRQRDGRGYYGTWADDFIKLDQLVAGRVRGIRTMRTFSGEALQTLQVQAIEHFVQRMQQWPAEQGEHVATGLGKGS